MDRNRKQLTRATVVAAAVITAGLTVVLAANGVARADLDPQAADYAVMVEDLYGALVVAILGFVVCLVALVIHWVVRGRGAQGRDARSTSPPLWLPLVVGVAALAAPGGPDLSFRFDLARRAFAHTAAYDGMIAGTLGDVRVDPARATFSREAASADSLLPQNWRPALVKIRDLRYGENPHQPGAWYADDAANGQRAGFGAAAVHQGKELSFTNLLDLDAAARLALEFDEPAAVVIKHTNPCGVATGPSLADAYVRARDADALSAFGGIVGLNRPLDVQTARALTATFIEAVVAPGLDDADAVLAVLRTKANLRVVTAAFEHVGDRDARSILGAWLVQARDRVTEAASPWPSSGDQGASGPRVVTRRAPTPEEWEALRFAWRVCAHVKSNTVVFTGRDVTIAVGAGQMSRVDAVNAAVMKGADSLRGSVAASDAFFPFRDGLDALAKAGATAVVQPGGSVRDAEVIAAADEHGLAMVFTGRRHFRH